MKKLRLHGEVIVARIDSAKEKIAEIEQEVSQQQKSEVANIKA